ncbi:MAG: fibrobacter succinogenes major paralogous domain-containing protein [Bacteroidota bacterium]
MFSDKKIGISLMFITGMLIILLCKCNKEDDSTIRDTDGNIYTSVKIGTQVWMIENLQTTKLNNNTNVTLMTENWSDESMSTPGYCWNENDESKNKTLYGALYNWHAVNTGKLCPIGWHVPTYDDWTTLITYLGGKTNAGGKLKETGYSLWQIPNEGATNESGFTGRPGGFYYGSGSFDQPGIEAYYWSSTESGPGNAYILKLSSDDKDAIIGSMDKEKGCSVRCIKE